MYRFAGKLGAMLLGASYVVAPAMAQEYPTKQPIRIVVAVVPGGATDAIARITADTLQRRLGQTVLVENKPGASGTIGADLVAKAAADGYTIFLGASEFPAVPALRTVPYKFDEMTFLLRGFTIPPLVIASPKFAATSLQDMVTTMKSKPKTVRFGSTGIGSISHMGLAMIEGSAGAKALHIPYQSIAPVYNDLMAGNIDITEGIAPFPEGLKVLGSAGSKRSAGFPNLPTLDEIGVKNANWDLWFGFMAPPNLPKPLADRLTAELAAVLKDPQAIAKFKDALKAEPDAEPLTGEAFKKQVLEENKRWKAVVEREKIVVQ